MQKPERRRTLEKFTVVENWPDDAPEARQRFEDGLKILAGMIARVIMRENSIQGKTLSGRNDDSGMSYSIANAVDQQEVKLALTVTEVAKLLGLSRSSTYDAVRKGQIPNIRIGKRIVIPRASLINMLKEAGN